MGDTRGGGEGRGDGDGQAAIKKGRMEAQRPAGAVEMVWAASFHSRSCVVGEG